MKKHFAIAALAAVIAGCASSPDKISAAYVSPIQYQSYDCEQIGTELSRVERRTTEVHGRLQKAADSDSVQMAVGMILFWPALFFLEGGDGPEAAEYARLKGERDALEKIANDKKCGRSVLPKPTTPENEAEQTRSNDSI